jgi:hypothetical protein
VYDCVKKSAACELSHVLTPSINSSLSVKRCERQPVLQAGKQVVVARSEIRTLKESGQTTPS